MKRGNNKNRGYCGWHITNKGDKVFLRSKLEFIFAKYLDYKKIEYKTESKIYNINGRNYKPDFFIWEDNILSIIEIKSNKKQADEYDILFSEYFRNINIEYKIIYNGFDKITKDLNLYKSIEVYKKSNMYNKKIGYKGEENPHYGLKHSDASLKIIGKKTNERMANPIWKERWFNIVNEGNKSIERRTKLKNTLKIKTENRIKELDIIDPIITKKCKFCKNIFEKRVSSERNFCSQLCAAKQNIILATKNNTGRIRTEEEKMNNYKCRVINLLNKSTTFMKNIIKIQSIDDLDFLLKDCYLKKEIKGNQPHKKESIMKCFKDINQLKLEMLNVNN